MSGARSPIVELGGSRLRVEGRELLPAPDLAELPREGWVVSDFGGALGRVMDVEAPARFAELVVRKRLQDAGEFDEPVHVITHWKRKRAAGMSQIFFTALPVSQYLAYLDKARTSDQGLLLFPVQGVLWSVLQGLRAPGAAAVLLAHEGFVDLLVGTASRPVAAFRLVAYAPGEEAWEGLWQSVLQELRLLVQDRHLELTRILGMHWLQDDVRFGQALEHLGAELGAQTLLLPTQDLSLDGASHQASLPHALTALRASRSVSPASSRALHYARRGAPWALAAGLILSLSLLGTGMWYRQGANELQARADELQQSLETRSRQAADQVPDYEPVLSFARELEWIRGAPAYVEVINELGAAMSPDMRIDALRVEHPPQGVTLVLHGHVNADFERAQTAHQGFLAALRRRGYEVVEQEFSTSIASSRFMLRMERPFG